MMPHSLFGTSFAFDPFPGPRYSSTSLFRRLSLLVPSGRGFLPISSSPHRGISFLFFRSEFVQSGTRFIAWDSGQSRIPASGGCFLLEPFRISTALDDRLLQRLSCAPSRRLFRRFFFFSLPKQRRRRPARSLKFSLPSVFSFGPEDDFSPCPALAASLHDSSGFFPLLSQSFLSSSPATT